LSRTRTPRFNLTIALVAGSLSACRWTVAIDALPDGATLHVGEVTYALPAEVTFERVGLRKHTVRVTAPSYRDLDVVLTRHELSPFRVAPRWLFAGRRDPQDKLTFMLVPAHGPITNQGSSP
jgi:hypothetical protein